MKFTNKDLAKAMGLKVGDRIKHNDRIYIINTDFNIRDKTSKSVYRLLLLINEEFEILSPKKKVGELRCKDFICDNCPLNFINCSDKKLTGETLYDILKKYNIHYKDQEIYDIMKKRLDKEVKEDE